MQEGLKLDVLKVLVDYTSYTNPSSLCIPLSAGNLGQVLSRSACFCWFMSLKLLSTWGAKFTHNDIGCWRQGPATETMSSFMTCISVFDVCEEDPTDTTHRKDRLIEIYMVHMSSVNIFMSILTNITQIIKLLLA